MTTIEEIDILEIEDIHQLREEIEILVRNISYYQPRIQELHERIFWLKATVDNFTKEEISIEERISSAYEIEWGKVKEKFTNVSIICSAENKRIVELEKKEIRYKRLLEEKSSKITLLEAQVATLLEEKEKLSSKLTEMTEWNVTFVNTKECILKTSIKQLAVRNAELSFFKATHKQTIGVKMYDEWVFDKTSIQLYWDEHIMQTTQIIRNIYRIRLEAEKRHLVQQYQIKVNRSETEIKKFKKCHKAQLVKLKEKVTKVQELWEKMDSNCSSMHDRHRCMRLRGEFSIMVDIVVSKLGNLSVTYDERKGIGEERKIWESDTKTLDEFEEEDDELEDIE